LAGFAILLGVFSASGQGDARPPDLPDDRLLRHIAGVHQRRGEEPFERGDGPRGAGQGVRAVEEQRVRHDRKT